MSFPTANDFPLVFTASQRERLATLLQRDHEAVRAHVYHIDTPGCEPWWVYLPNANRDVTLLSYGVRRLLFGGWADE
jgi:hypothetical protein